MNLAGRPTWREVIRGYATLPHPTPVVLVMIATGGFGLLAARGWPGLGPALRLLGAMFGAQIAIGAVNDLVDVELDALSRPDKPIPAALVTPRGALVVAALGIVLMTALSATFGVASVLLCSLGTAAGIAYSLWFKRTIWSWIPYLVALPLLPLWVWVALAEVDLALFAIYPIGAAAVVAVQLAQSLPDVKRDRAAGVETLAIRLGAWRALWLCWGATLLAAGLATALAGWLTDQPERVWWSAVAAAVLVGIEVAIWRRDNAQGILLCFPLTAVATGLLGLGWAAALVNG
jgi:4-hydroxybenzoate polyprenyltransferase